MSSNSNSNTHLTVSGGDNSQEKGNASSSIFAMFGGFKVFLLILMVLQNSSTVLVGRYTRSSVPAEELYDVNHLILIIEATKFALSCALEFYVANGKLFYSLQQHVFNRPTDAMKMTVPALLYLVQNTLLYVALSNLSAPLFQVTYQGKLVTTALVSVVMLNRSYSPQQWICLVFLSLGVAIVVLGEQGHTSNDSANSQKQTSQQDKETTENSKLPHQNNLFVGLVAVTIACLSSALAGVYFEKVLKKPSANNESAKVPPASIWMRNIQLAFYSVVIAACQGFWKSVKEVPKEGQAKSYIHGFTIWVWVLVALQAGGGLLVAAVIKYADNVLKGLATGVSVVLATSISITFFNTPLTGQFFLGATLILSSVYVFSNPIPMVVGKPRESDKLVLPK